MSISASHAGLRLLHVHAHPDDESSKGAATTAYYVDRGARVLVATCTGGERGDILNPALDTPENWARLPQLRRAELAEAVRVLGAEQVWLGFPDSGFPDPDAPAPLDSDCFAAQDVDEAAGRLVPVIREFRPQVVTTYNEFGGYPHPDHVMTHKITMAALSAAADPARWPEHGPAWDVPKLYYDVAMQRARFAALDAIMREHGLDSPYTERLARMPDDPALARTVTTRIPCDDYFETRDRALLAHATQIDPDGHWFRVPLELQRQAWPTEDYELVWSRVATSIPEDDLFAGVEP